MTDNNVVGYRIRSLRQRKRMTLEELGNILGVQKSVVAKYENGSVANLKISTIKKIAETFGVSPLYIMGFTDIMNYEKRDELVALIDKMDDSQIAILLSVAKEMVK